MSQKLSSTLDDHELVRHAKLGDRNAFSELVQQHRAGVINLIYRICGDGQIAEDAAQNAFIQAWQNLNQYKPKYAFRSWIYRIAANAAIDLLRREVDSLDIDGIQLPSKTVRPEASVENDERSAQIQNAVLALPYASRVVLILREYEGLSYRQISETLEIPLGTVMSRLNYARNLLRKELAPLVEER